MCPLVFSGNIHPPQNALFRVMAPVWVCLGCYNKIPKTEWLKQYTFMSHSSGGWKIKVPADLVSDGSPLPSSHMYQWRRKWQPLQYSFLKSSTDRGGWRATVHGVTRFGHDWVTKLPPLPHGWEGGLSSLSWKDTNIILVTPPLWPYLNLIPSQVLDF